MKRIFLAAVIATFAAGTAFAQDSCASKAVGKDGKPLAGAAKTAFMKKCMHDSCETKAVGSDGKKLAVAANFKSASFRLWLGDDPKDFALASSTQTAVPACKLAWRGDSKELAVIDQGANCSQPIGTLERVPVNDVRSTKVINPSANDPAYQPVTLGG